MKKFKEIQVLVDDFRIDVIKAILSAYPERAVDDGDPSNDTFLIDGIPVKVEADRIVVGDDLDNYISLKNAPIAGQPPRYRGINSILTDFEAYINKEKREEHTIMTTEIKEKVQIPGTNILLEKGDKVIYKEATEIFKKSYLKHPGDIWYTKDKYWGVYWDKDDPSVIWIYHTDQWGEDYYESEDLNYADVNQIVFNGTASYSVKESVKVKESTIADIEKLLKKTGWDIEETDDDFLLAQYGDEIFSINADSGEVNIGTDEGSETIWTGSYDDFIKTYKGVKDNMIIVDNKSFKAVTESTKRMKESMSSRDVYEAQAYWKKLCKRYKTADKLERAINEQDGDKFFEFMANALGLDVIDDYEILEENLDEFYEKVTDPIEIEIFGEPVSSAF